MPLASRPMLIRRAVAAASLLSVIAISITPAKAQTSIPDLVDSMSVREKIGQVVMPPIPGRTLSSSSRKLIRDLRLGGVILFAFNYSNRTQLKRLTGALQRVATNASPNDIGMLISVDQEGGVVKRFPDLAPYFGAPQADSRQEAYRMGRSTGIDLRRVGVNLNLAPVADLDRGPARVMAARSFGRQPRTVEARVGSYVDGLLSGGTAGVVKHFPGLGAGHANTDDERVVVRLSRKELFSDGKPFTVARGKARVAVMTSNAIYPAYQAGVPGSVSKKVINHLRSRLGADTLVITDSLNAIAWAFGGSTPRACPAAIAAGADIALITGGAGTTRSCVKKIRAAVRDGVITHARLDEAVTHVLRMKRNLGLLP